MAGSVVAGVDGRIAVDGLSHMRIIPYYGMAVIQHRRRVAERGRDGRKPPLGVVGIENPGPVGADFREERAGGRAGRDGRTVRRHRVGAGADGLLEGEAADAGKVAPARLGDRPAPRAALGDRRAVGDDRERFRGDWREAVRGVERLHRPDAAGHRPADAREVDAVAVLVRKEGVGAGREPIGRDWRRGTSPPEREAHRPVRDRDVDAPLGAGLRRERRQGVGALQRRAERTRRGAVRVAPEAEAELDAAVLA